MGENQNDFSILILFIKSWVQREVFKITGASLKPETEETKVQYITVWMTSPQSEMLCQVRNDMENGEKFEGRK